MKTSELTGAELDLAVAKCDGAGEEWRSDAPFLWGGVACIRVAGHDVNYKPSTDWSQGGPIIGRESIQLTLDKTHNMWRAFMTNEGIGYEYWGPTPLIAAMRAFIASRLGNEVQNEPI